MKKETRNNINSINNNNNSITNISRSGVKYNNRK